MSEEEARFHEREAMRIRGGRRPVEEVALEVLGVTQWDAKEPGGSPRARAARCLKQILGKPADTALNATILANAVRTPEGPEWAVVQVLTQANAGTVYVRTSRPSGLAEIDVRALLAPMEFRDAPAQPREDRFTIAPREPRPLEPDSPRQRAREKTRENVRRRPPRTLR